MENVIRAVGSYICTTRVSYGVSLSTSEALADVMRGFISSLLFVIMLVLTIRILLSL
jgi:hypothetical protein